MRKSSDIRTNITKTLQNAKRALTPNLNLKKLNNVPLPNSPLCTPRSNTLKNPPKQGNNTKKNIPHMDKPMYNDY